MSYHKIKGFPIGLRWFTRDSSYSPLCNVTGSLGHDIARDLSSSRIQDGSVFVSFSSSIYMYRKYFCRGKEILAVTQILNLQFFSHSFPYSPFFFYLYMCTECIMSILPKGIRLSLSQNVNLLFFIGILPTITI